MSGDRPSPLPLYVPLRGLGAAVGLVFVLNAAVCWVAAGFDLAEVRRIATIQRGDASQLPAPLAFAVAADLFTAARLAAGALLAAVFLPWLYRARVNVRALGMRRLRFGREWTVLGFLVPGLNLVRPCQVVAEVWRASDPASGDPLAWRGAPLSNLVPAWWWTFVASLGLALASALLLQLATGLPRLQLAHGLALTGNVCAAVSASVGWFLTARLGRAQETKRARFGDGAMPGASPSPRPLDPRDVPA